MSNFDNLTPGSLAHVGSSDDGGFFFGLVHYIIAAIVFFVYAKNTFRLGVAILYSLFWEFGLIYSLLS